MSNDAARDSQAAYLADRLAVVTCIAEDCAELIATGDEIPASAWLHLRQMILSGDDRLDVWRELPMYARAKAQIQANMRSGAPHEL